MYSNTPTIASFSLSKITLFLQCIQIFLINYFWSSTSKALKKLQKNLFHQASYPEVAILKKWSHDAIRQSDAEVVKFI